MSDTTTDLDAMVDAGTALLGIELRPEWREAVRMNLAVSLNFGRLVTDFPLPDEAEPAPVFRA